MNPNGEYAIYVFKENEWYEIGSLSYDKFFREREISIGSLRGETVRIKLQQKGGGAAHIDSVFLGGNPPLQVNGGDAFELKKLSRKDFDVIDAFGKSIELIFPVSGSSILNLTARVEGERISETPFLFPAENHFDTIDENSQFYTYRLNSNAQEPFFKEYSITGSGHPSGFTYGWVRNDNENLYVTIDFTPDNTMDGNKDYAKVYVKTAAGVKEFKVTMADIQWGIPDFTYTDKVAYQHKVYEFRIPLTEIGTVSDKILLAFAAYGTASPGNHQPDIAYDTHNNR